MPEQPDAGRPSTIEPVKADGSQQWLADRVTAKLRQGGQLATVYGARNVRMDLDGPLKASWAKGHIAMGELWSYYCKYPYLTRLRDRSVLDAAVRDILNEIAWNVEGYALAAGFDETSGRYQGLTVPLEDTNFGPISDSTLIVVPEVALAQRHAERQAAAGSSTEPAGQTREDEQHAAAVFTHGAAGPTTPTASPTSAAVPASSRFFGVMELNPERYGRDLTRIAQEVLQHLSAVEGTTLQVRVEISAINPNGFPDDKSRIVTENARTLKFEQFGFEKE